MAPRENVDAALGATESDARRLGRLRDVLSDEAAAARCREEFDRTGRFTTADIDRPRGGRARSARAAPGRCRPAAGGHRTARLSPGAAAERPRGRRGVHRGLDGQAPSWRRTGTRPSDIDHALDAAERGRDPDQPPAWRHRLVLKAERAFPGAASTAWRDAGAGFDRSTETSRQAGSVSRTLSDRARARALAAERPEPPASPGLVKRLFEWLRERVERLLHKLRPSKAAHHQDRSPANAAADERHQRALSEWSALPRRRTG